MARRPGSKEETSPFVSFILFSFPFFLSLSVSVLGFDLTDERERGRERETKQGELCDVGWGTIMMEREREQSCEEGRREQARKEERSDLSPPSSLSPSLCGRSRNTRRELR